MSHRATAVTVYGAVVSLMMREYLQRGCGMPDGAYIGRIHQEAARLAAIAELGGE